MSYRLETSEKWDANYFTNFFNFRNSLYEGHYDYISESLNDFFLFHENSTFSRDNYWKAQLIYENDSQPVARYLINFRPDSPQKAIYLGFFEAYSNSSQLTAFLGQCLQVDLDQIKKTHPKMNTVIGPIQGSLFNGGRFRMESKKDRFFSEPLHRDYYPTLWKNLGFTLYKEWESFKISTISVKNHLEKLESTLGNSAQSTILSLSPKVAKNFKKNIFQITMDAYDFENTNDEISLDEFSHLSKNAEPIILKKFSGVLLCESQTEGFAISLKDIQNDIRWYNKKRLKWPLFDKFWILILLLRFQFARRPVIALYVAKTKEAKTKWLLAKLAVHSLKSIKPSNPPYFITAFNAKNSGSRSTLPGQKELYSTHFLMAKSF